MALPPLKGPARVSVDESDANLDRFENALASLGEDGAVKVLGRALNHTAGVTRTAVVRAASKQSSIPLRTVRASVDLIKARTSRTTRDELRALIVGTGAPIPLREFKAKQFTWGVRAKVFGKSTRFPGLFIMAGTPRSGKEVSRGHVFQNTRQFSVSSGRANRIERQDGPAVPTEIIRGEAAKVFERTLADRLPKRVAHELERVLP